MTDRRQYAESKGSGTVEVALCLLRTAYLLRGLYLQPSILAKRGWLLLFLGIAAFYLWGLGALPLVGPDEPRYAEVAREMFVRRVWE